MSNSGSDDKNSQNSDDKKTGDDKSGGGKEGGGDNKSPAAGGMAAKAKEVIKQKVQEKMKKHLWTNPKVIAGVILGYIIATWLTVVGVAISSIIMTFIYGSKGPAQKECYSGFDLGAPTRFTLNAKGNIAIGKKPVTINDIGQTTAWIDTKLVTNGRPVEVYAQGAIYPWGKDAVAKRYSFVEIGGGETTMKEKINGGASVSQYKMVYADKRCDLTTDINMIDANDPKDRVHLRNNPLDRYNLNQPGKATLDQQVEAIMDVHCFDRNCNNKRPTTDMDFEPCYLDDGHGVYMKFGDTKYAFHIANYRVPQYRKVFDENTNDFKYVMKVNDVGEIITKKIPFSLPTRVYKWNHDPDSFTLASELAYDLQSPNQENTKYVELAQEYECEADGGVKEGDDKKEEGEKVPRLDPQLIHETCRPPPKGLPVYVAVNDIYYNDNDGEVELVFHGGVQAPADTNGASNFLATLMSFILEPFFGPGDPNSHSLINIDSNKPGAVIDMRNNLLSNVLLQNLKLLLIIFTIMMYGYDFFLGLDVVTVSSLLRKFLKLSFVVWATDPSNYDFMDRILIPALFEGIWQLGAILVEGAVKFGGLSLTTYNPYEGMATFLKFIFSEVIGYKIAGIIMSYPALWVTMIALFILIIFIGATVFYASILIILSISLSAVILSVLPLTVILMLYSKTQDLFMKAVRKLVSECIHGTFMCFLVTLLFALVIKYYRDLFYFDVCWRELWNLTIFGITIFTIYAWKIQTNIIISDFMVNLLMLGIMAALAYTTFRKADDIVKDLFGTSSSGMKEGAKNLDNLLNITAAAALPDRFMKQIHRDGVFGMAKNYGLKGARVLSHYAPRAAAAMGRNFGRGVTSMARNVSSAANKVTSAIKNTGTSGTKPVSSLTPANQSNLTSSGHRGGLGGPTPGQGGVGQDGLIRDAKGNIIKKVGADGVARDVVVGKDGLLRDTKGNLIKDVPVSGEASILDGVVRDPNLLNSARMDKLRPHLGSTAARDLLRQYLNYAEAKVNAIDPSRVPSRKGSSQPRSRIDRTLPGNKDRMRSSEDRSRSPRESDKFQTGYTSRDGGKGFDSRDPNYRKQPQDWSSSSSGSKVKDSNNPMALGTSGIQGAEFNSGLGGNIIKGNELNKGTIVSGAASQNITADNSSREKETAAKAAQRKMEQQKADLHKRKMTQLKKSSKQHIGSIKDSLNQLSEKLASGSMPPQQYEKEMAALMEKIHTLEEGLKGNLGINVSKEITKSGIDDKNITSVQQKFDIVDLMLGKLGSKKKG